MSFNLSLRYQSCRLHVAHVLTWPSNLLISVVSKGRQIWWLCFWNQSCTIVSTSEFHLSSTRYVHQSNHAATSIKAETSRLPVPCIKTEKKFETHIYKRIITKCFVVYRAVVLFWPFRTFSFRRLWSCSAFTSSCWEENENKTWQPWWVM